VELRNPNLGLFVKLPSTQAIEIAAAADFDFCVIDLEHSQLSEGDAIGLASHAAAIEFPALVRIPEVDRGAVNRLLEAGAVGIQLSTVRRAEQVAELRAATRYSPEGDRSISLAHRRADYGGTSMADYLGAERSSPPLVVAQIETATTDDPLEEILAAAPDVAFIGTADLRADVGLDQGAYERRVEEIVEATVSTDVVLGAFGLEDPRVTYRLITSDLTLLRTGAATAVENGRPRFSAG
jgi:4-hydroxy-2-oxoheptanedioate aldolase